MNVLATKYLDLDLATPIVASPSPMTRSIDSLMQVEDAGAGAVVLPSLFEEDVESEAWSLHERIESGLDIGAESFHFHPDLDLGHLVLERHLRLVEHAAQRLSIPVIASVNGTTAGGWVEYGKRLVEAGAAAIELNMYDVATDPTRSAIEVEAGYLSLVRAVRVEISVPLAVKVGPCFSSFAHFAAELVGAGADGIVMFNRFYQPDLDIVTRDIEPRLNLSTSADLGLPLRWIGVLRPLLPETSLALTSGVHSAADAVKGLLAGADVVMVASALLRDGAARITTLNSGIRDHLAEHGYGSVAQLRGSAARHNTSHPARFERVQYHLTLDSWQPNANHHWPTTVDQL